MRQLITYSLAFLFAHACGACDHKPQTLSYQVHERHPRDSSAFTQGLEIYRGRLLHSSGLYGQSYVEAIAVPGETANRRLWRTELAESVFAEGLSVFKGRLYLLSWRQGQWWALDPATGQRLAGGRYRGEGWGLTHNDRALIRSDGSDRLTFHAPKDFKVLKSLPVTDRGRPLEQINELEKACGLIWANLWHSDRIVAIDPTTGRVSAEVDLSKLVATEAPSSPEAVLNGIAWDGQRRGFWLTGKRWQYWYLVRFNRPDGGLFCPGGHKKAAPDEASDAARG